jgi:hypothetical protein
MRCFALSNALSSKKHRADFGDGGYLPDTQSGKSQERISAIADSIFLKSTGQEESISISPYTSSGQCARSRPDGTAHTSATPVPEWLA